LVPSPWWPPLGQGGFATVYRAGRDNAGVRQEVALKLLHRGLHSTHARRQFQRERLALVQLRHPGIAHLIEAGVTEDGLAWIALELVDGLPITEHVRLHQLPLAARLRLFIQVCRAVDAAHRALIVHRDLKPSNVLVTAEGQVKLLDFGIAKLLETEPEDTRTQMHAFTPAYAAPEQRQGGLITTATDVYALGVLLGELLTGVRLQGGSTDTPSGRVTATSEPGVLPAPPSLTRRLLRGDLDNIVLKALADEPERRYPSAGALADDIERYLQHRPVLAHPPSAWYRTRRFVKRHVGGVVFTALLVVGILASLGVALWQAKEAREQAALAREQTARAEAVRDFLLSVFEAGRADVPRERRPAIEDIVEDAGHRILEARNLGDGTRADMLLALAQVHHRLAAYERALAMLDAAEPLLESLHGRDDPRWWRARLLRAAVLLDQADHAQALAVTAPLLDLLRARRDGITLEGLRLHAAGLTQANRLEEARAVYAEVRALADTVAGDPAREHLRTDTSEAMGLVYAQHFPDGLAVADRAWQRWQALDLPPDRDVLNLLQSISIAAEAVGDEARAETAYRDAIDLAERLHARPHPDTAWVIGIYGSYLVARLRFDEAESHVERALEMRRQLLGDAHPDTLNGMAAMGRLRAGQMRHEESLKWFREGVELCRRHQVQHNVCPRLLASLSQMMLTADEGGLDGIEALAREALDWQARLTGADSRPVFSLKPFLVRVLLRRQRYAEALDIAGSILERFESAGAMGLEAMTARLYRAQALLGLGRSAEALQESQALEAEFRRDFADSSSGTLFNILYVQARALDRLGRREEARRAAEAALAVELPSPHTGSMKAAHEELAGLAGHRTRR